MRKSSRCILYQSSSQGHLIEICTCIVKARRYLSYLSNRISCIGNPSCNYISRVLYGKVNILYTSIPCVAHIKGHCMGSLCITLSRRHVLYCKAWIRQGISIICLLGSGTYPCHSNGSTILKNSTILKYNKCCLSNLTRNGKSYCRPWACTGNCKNRIYSCRTRFLHYRIYIGSLRY